MTRLRARSSKTIPSRERIAELKRGRRQRSANDEFNKGNTTAKSEPISRKFACIIFLIICALGGYKEYWRVKALPRWQSSRVGVANNSNLRAARAAESYQTADHHEALEFDAATDNTRYHLIFSTDCSPYQHWQSYLVFFTAMRVKQPGTVTRIASGCEPKEAKEMQTWFQNHIQAMSSRFHLHLTPHFSGVKNKDGQQVAEYKFFNKPFGLLHWMQHAEHLNVEEMQDDVVILIDPDMALLRPITRDFSNPNEVVYGMRRKAHVLGKRVEHGLPFAQTYGLGTKWETFDLAKIAGPDSPAAKMSKEEGFLYFPAGPPYIATVKDMYQIALKWTEFVPLVHDQYPHLLAEMYAYCIACAHLGLRHQLVDSLMVSNTEMDGAEGWPLIADIPLDAVCEIAAHPDPAKHPVPAVVHLCQRYAVGDEWFFGKRKVPHDFYACEKPLLKEPPANLAALYDFKKFPNAPDQKPMNEKIARREAFMLCFLHTVMNQAATYYKQNSCPAGTANLEKTMRMVDLFRH